MPRLNQILFVDTETCGLHGMPVLIQYAVGDGPIELYNIWLEPVGETLELIEWMTQFYYCGFNNTFDIFHLTKCYNVLRHLPKDAIPIDHIHKIVEIEESCRATSLAWKPIGQIDLMLYARKGPYQSTMPRKDIRIKRVPYVLAPLLRDELNKRIPLKDIYFARSKNMTRWRCLDIFDDDDVLVKDFQDVVLKFAPSSALKALAVDALGIKEVIKFEDNPLTYPKGFGYAPFALAGWKDSKGNICKPERMVLKSGNIHYNYGETWAAYIKEHVKYWDESSLGKQYAEDDVTYTRDLYKHFLATPIDGIPFEFDDDDSVLATCVANVRWIGYSVDLDALKNLVLSAKEKIVGIPTYAAHVKAWLYEDMDEIEKLVVTGTSKLILEEVSKWETPAGIKALKVLAARHAEKEINLYEKIIRAGRFHASFKIIGTLSSRMAGTDGLNAQGINREGEARKCFSLLVDPEHELWGGDFDAFEISLMDAIYHDPRMHKELLGEKKIHGLWGERYFFPHMTYEEIGATKGTLKDYYTLSKNGVFAVCYFGEAYTLTTRVGISEDIANEAYHRILHDYPTFANARRDVVDQFCSMQQPNGIGTKVEWHEPADYINSMFGFRRYFTLENTICKVLFNLAEDVPAAWQNLKGFVQRRERKQTASGAVMSALFAAAFAIQGSNMRAAGNHKIQSSGSTVNKRVQRRVWDIQPVGINPFLVAPMNIHDELMCSTDKSITQQVKTVVDTCVAEFKDDVPLIKMEWGKLKNWSEK